MESQLLGRQRTIADWNNGRLLLLEVIDHEQSTRCAVGVYQEREHESGRLSDSSCRLIGNCSMINVVVSCTNTKIDMEIDTGLMARPCRSFDSSSTQC